MIDNTVLSITAIIILSSIVCRISVMRHRKNYDNFLSELEDSNSKYDRELNIFMKYVSKHHEIQELNQGNYVLVIMIVLIKLFHNR
ncbi:hypothetical protein SAMN05661008_01088 [Alkalithermobacter thermoalcaliphilus JW-YL-7 = DSM 7308]|uniref:Uncharacterized protein n=1 Tax=Alkalithermobacter thermoalcaliphilus JW-YL-7 = DSM 7308 TaxID=1121328 RepID=A0A150FNB1_CLOPD|nr:hypothetical protein JWYL7_0177 [[Clostridium] paradoxum JW-YL-7 = DSM 7308]SHK89995.1 hypothetical protein SAMN05661008_01088 [[Clostridium] paradoxum JW-YL-7 = DSM 7308]